MKSIKKLMDTAEWEYTVVSDEGTTDKLCMYLNFGIIHFLSTEGMME